MPNRPCLFPCVASAGIVLFVAGASMAQDCGWSTLDQGLSNAALDMVTFDDGSGAALYAGGTAQTASGVTIRGLGRWDGSAWSAVGAGFDGDVRALATFDDGTGEALYAGGFVFVNGAAGGNRVARWDGTAWTTLGSNINDRVLALAGFDDGTGPALYAAGSFTQIAGQPVAYVAKWNGTAWEQVGDLGGPFAGMRALCVFDDGTGPALYAGGQAFTIDGGTREHRVAKWDGTAWTPLVTDPADDIANSIVYAFDTYDDGAGAGERLYIGGSFINDPTRTGRTLLSYDGTGYTAIPDPPNNTVFHLDTADDGTGERLYPSGSFGAVGAQPTSFLAGWDGSAWQTFTGANDIVWAVTGYDDGTGPAVYAAGNLTQVGDGPIPASRIARFACAVACPGDFNADGLVNILDVVGFINNWNAQGPGADFNEDGSINILDVVGFIGVWNAGCP
jgi:hypothetical protein